jgi:hypothetical protein
MTFTINASFGAGVPSGYVTSVDEAISYFEHKFHNQVTENIKFDFAPLGGNAVAQSQTQLESGGYATIANNLFNTDAGITADQGLMLPRSDPFGGNFFITVPEAAAIGFSTPNILDATVTLNSKLSYTSNPNNVGPGQYDAVGVLEHEISETMGRICGSNGGSGLLPAPEALFRYRSPGHIDTTDGIGDHFSINGTTSLHAHMGESGGDLADWTQANSDCVGFAVQGIKQVFSAADVRVMEALGWNTAGAAATPLSPVENSLALSSVLAAGHDFSA